MFSIAIYCPTDDKCQSKSLFLATFYPRSSIVRSVFDCRISVVVVDVVVVVNLFWASNRRWSYIAKGTPSHDVAHLWISSDISYMAGNICALMQRKQSRINLRSRKTWAVFDLESKQQKPADPRRFITIFLIHCYEDCSNMNANIVMCLDPYLN